MTSNPPNLAFEESLKKFRAQGVQLDVAGVPELLKSRDRWMGWVATPRMDRNGEIKISKPPCSLQTGRPISKAKQANWHAFSDVAAALSRGIDGAGYMPGDGIVCIDLDNARDHATGQWKDWAVKIIQGLDSFTEVSPSGNGVHVWLQAEVGPEKPTMIKVEDGRCEIYREGAFVTCTAVVPYELNNGRDVEQRQAELDALFARLAPVSEEPKAKAGQQPITSNGTGEGDRELLQRSFSFTKGSGPQAAQLWAGNLEGVAGDHSAGDFQLCRHLAWLLNKDAARMDALFRESGLMRPKWDEVHGAATYGQLTLTKAIEKTKTIYKPRQSAGISRADYIVVRVDNLDKVACSIEKVLTDPSIPESCRLFSRCGRLVQVVRDPAPTAINGVTRPADAPRLIPADRNAVAVLVTRYAKFAKEEVDRKTGEAVLVPVKVPMDAVDSLLSTPQLWTAPPLRGIIEAPVIRPDQSILNSSGYDAATAYFLSQSMALDVPEAPTPKQAEDAIKVLWQELLQGFCFADDADKYVAMSLLMSAIMRPVLDFVPLHAVTAPVRGSGKSFLVDVAAMLAQGRELAVIQFASDPEELRKTIGATMLAGDSMVSLDNVNGELKSDFLCQCLTQHAVKPRILGKSQVPAMPNIAFWCATGNNILLSGDLPRRSLLCKLDPRCERPELREFSFSPVARARDQRAKYVSAILTILRAYDVAGRPKVCTPLAGFEAWSGLIRSTIMWLYPTKPESDVVLSQNFIAVEDPEQLLYSSLLTAWAGVFGTQSRAMPELVAWFQKQEAGQGTESECALAQAMLEIAGDRGNLNSRRLGKYLSANNSRIMAGFRLQKAGMLGHNAQWQVVKA